MHAARQFLPLPGVNGAADSKSGLPERAWPQRGLVARDEPRAGPVAARALTLAETRRNLGDVLDEFFELANSEAPEVVPVWGAKACHSIFDEDVVLANPAGGDSGAGRGPPESGEPSSQTRHRAEPSHEEQAVPAIVWVFVWPSDLQDITATGNIASIPGQLLNLPSAALDVLPATMGVGRATPARSRAGVESREVRALRRMCCVSALEEDSKEQCMVCLQAMECGQRAWRLPCLHQAHDECCSAYFGTRGVRLACPLCRWDARKGAIHDAVGAAGSVHPLAAPTI